MWHYSEVTGAWFANLGIAGAESRGSHYGVSRMQYKAPGSLQARFGGACLGFRPRFNRWRVSPSPSQRLPPHPSQTSVCTALLITSSFPLSLRLPSYRMTSTTHCLHLLLAQISSKAHYRIKHFDEPSMRATTAVSSRRVNDDTYTF